MPTRVTEEERLRAALTKRKKVARISDAMWELLRDPYILDSYGTFEDNLERLSDFYDKASTAGQRERASHAGADSTLSARSAQFAREDRRRDVVDILVSNALTKSEIVTQLRTRLGIDPYETGHPKDLIDSMALRVCPPEFFRTNNIPIEDHTAHSVAVHRDEASGVVQFSAWVDPPGAVVDYAMPAGQELVGEEIEVTIQDGEELARTVAWSPSVLWLIAKASQSLAEYYPWSAAQCATFLFALSIPPATAITYEVLPQTRPGAAFQEQVIELRAPIWVSADTVATLFKSLQQVVLEGDRRDLSDRNVEVVAFVEAFSEIALGRGKWKWLVGVWNETRRLDWGYVRKDGAPDSNRFSRDYHRTKEQLMRGGGSYARAARSKYSDVRDDALLEP